MSTGNKISVLLETRSVGSSCNAASSSGRVKIVSLLSLSSFPIVYVLFFLLATRTILEKETKKRRRIRLESREIVAFRDLAGNRLTTLHRDTFLDMTRLNHL